MPGGDRTGPFGRGPKTGRGLGFCSGNDQPGYVFPSSDQSSGLGFRWGGGGRGRRDRIYANRGPGRGRNRFPASAAFQEQDVESLKEQTQELKNLLQEIRERLEKLEPQNVSSQ